MPTVSIARNHLLKFGRIAYVGELPMSRADVGDYLGLTIETVSRAVSKLRKGGHVRLDGARSIKILRPQAMRDMCD